MKYLILFLAQLALLVVMTYVAASLDGLPALAARSVVAICIVTGGLTAWQASRHFRETRDR